MASHSAEEVDASAGLPKTILAGMPEASVRESIHRMERPWIVLLAVCGMALAVHRLCEADRSGKKAVVRIEITPSAMAAISKSHRAIVFLNVIWSTDVVDGLHVFLRAADRKKLAAHSLTDAYRDKGGGTAHDGAE